MRKMINRRNLVSGSVTSTQRISQVVHRHTIENSSNSNNGER